MTTDDDAPRAASVGALSVDEVRSVVRAASLAPSLHNSQPWQFVARQDGSIDVLVDRSRRLPAIDESGRQLIVSVGAAVEFGRLAVRGLDRACAVVMRPDPDDTDLMARLVPGATEPATGEEISLLAAMQRRHTDRGPYDDTPVPTGLLETLRVGVERLGLWMRVIDLPLDRVVVGAALWDAEAALRNDPDYVEELRRATDASDRREGLRGVAGAWPANRVSDVPLRDFVGNSPRLPDAAPEVERDALVLLGSVDDDVSSFLAAGRAVAWMWLRLTVAGLSAQPLGQSLDDEAGRVRLAHDLRVIGHPQFLFRIGYGHLSVRTPRRLVSHVLAVPD